MCDPTVGQQCDLWDSPAGKRRKLGERREQRGPQAPTAEATKAAQRAGIDHAKGKDDRAYLGRKPGYTRDQFIKVREMLDQGAVGIAQVATETGLTRQTVYRIKDDPAGSEAGLMAWGM